MLDDHQHDHLTLKQSEKTICALNKEIFSLKLRLSFLVQGTDAAPLVEKLEVLKVNNDQLKKQLNDNEASLRQMESSMFALVNETQRLKLVRLLNLGQLGLVE